MFFQNSLEYILASIHAQRDFTDEYVASDDQASYFKEMSNRKKDGSLRYIYEPRRDIHANLYKALYEELKNYQNKLHEAAHGFRMGKSNVTNAAMHLGAGHLFNIDIENFYAHVNVKHVAAVFAKLGANSDTAEYLAKLCTINGVLPQGLNTSPDIANHHLYELDAALTEYAIAHQITYTRYVDDMSFSSSTQIDSSEIMEIVESFDLPISETKRKYQKRGANQYVTGLTIFDTQMPRISKKYKRRLRLELYIINKIGINQHIITTNELAPAPEDEEVLERWRENRNSWADKKLSQLRGRIDYVNGVERALAQRMYPILENIIDERKRELESEG